MTRTGRSESVSKGLRETGTHAKTKLAQEERKCIRNAENHHQYHQTLIYYESKKLIESEPLAWPQLRRGATVRAEHLPRLKNNCQYNDMSRGSLLSQFRK